MSFINVYGGVTGSKRQRRIVVQRCWPLRRTLNDDLQIVVQLGKSQSCAVVRLGGRSLVPIRAMVISNCQCLPLASWLTTFSSNTLFDFWGVHLLQPEDRMVSITNFVEAVRGKYNLIITIPLSQEYYQLSSDSIEKTFCDIPVVKISNIYFSGLHPDLTYIGGLSRRIMGPLGDYHSKLALYGFIKDLNLAQTEDLFDVEVYRRSGYFELYQSSFKELQERDQYVDVRASDILMDLVRSRLCFFSVNHPTPAFFCSYCNKIIRYLESKNLCTHSGLPEDQSLCAESLASSVIFPIYSEIAVHHGVPSLGSYAFKGSGSRVNPINLSEFLAKEFEAFQAFGKEALSSTHDARNILASVVEVE